MDADQPPLLFQTDHAIDLGVGNQVADFFAKAALGAAPHIRMWLFTTCS
jgi:hypothetical protein